MYTCVRPPRATCSSTMNPLSSSVRRDDLGRMDTHVGPVGVVPVGSSDYEGPILPQQPVNVAECLHVIVQVLQDIASNHAIERSRFKRESPGDVALDEVRDCRLGGNIHHGQVLEPLPPQIPVVAAPAVSDDQNLPGATRNTHSIHEFISKEGREAVVPTEVLSRSRKGHLALLGFEQFGISAGDPGSRSHVLILLSPCPD